MMYGAVVQIVIDLGFGPSKGSINGIKLPCTKSINFSPSTVPLVNSTATRPSAARAEIADTFPSMK